MWSKSYTKLYKGVLKEDIWHIYADVNSWPKWDKELEYCKMETNFIEGSQFILKPKEAPEITITLSEVKLYEKFTDCCKFFGATMYDIHEIKETPEGVLLTNTIEVKGPLSLIWTYLVAKNVAASIPQQLDALVEAALRK